MYLDCLQAYFNIYAHKDMPCALLCSIFISINCSKTNNAS